MPEPVDVAVKFAQRAIESAVTPLDDADRVDFYESMAAYTEACAEALRKKIRGAVEPRKIQGLSAAEMRRRVLGGGDAAGS